MAPSVRTPKDKKKKSGKRVQAMRVWDEALDTLTQATSAYIKETAILFRKFNTDDESAADSGADATVEDGLRHIDRRLERLAALERDLNNTRVGLQVRIS